MSIPASVFTLESVLEARERLMERKKNGKLTQLEVFREALKLDPHDHIALTAIGADLVQQGRPEEAVDYLWRSIAACPSAPEGYGWLNQAVRDVDPELADSLMSLVTRRLLRDPNYGPGVREKWIARFPAKTGDVLSDMVSEVLEGVVTDLSRGVPNEPSRVTEKLRPHRLIQDIIDSAGEALDRDTVDEILKLGAPCVPLLVGVLRAWAQDELPDDDNVPARIALALLGEIGDPRTLPAIVDLTDIEEAGVAVVAAWAAHRIAEQHPDLQEQVRLAPFPPPDHDVYDFCCSPFESDEGGQDFTLDPFEAEPRPAPIGRNDPCWCGSGKKYKKCHMEEDQNEPSWEEQDGEAFTQVFEQLVDFAGERLDKDEIGRAADIFFGGSGRAKVKESDELAFGSWLLCAHRVEPSRRTLAEEYFERHGDLLPIEQQTVLRAWIQGGYHLLEVLRVESGVGFQVKDFLLDKTYFVYDEPGSEQVAAGECVFAFVAEELGERVLYTECLVAPREVCPELRRWIAQERKGSDLKGREFLRQNCHRIRQEVVRLRREWVKVRAATTQAEALVHCKAKYDILNLPAVMAALEASPVFSMAGEQSGVLHFNWLEDVNSGSAANHILGEITIKKDRLTLECNSRERLKRGVDLLRDFGTGMLKPKGQQFQSAKS
ncbi:MAG: SEC-C metal-binding domain-containing protein [Bryobacteraceae bacterium]